MSGSSLDGLDLALCRFEFNGSKEVVQWEYLEGATKAFPAKLKQALREASQATPAKIMQLDAQLGRFFGEAASGFLKACGVKPDLIASHGHTLLHEPEAGYSLQIGSGAQIAEVTGLPVIDRFRDRDIAAGGQGAPLAPTADLFLFPEFDAWLNLGGIANLSLRILSGGIKACDVTGANQPLNALAAENGHDFDPEGRLAASGRLIPDLFEKLNRQAYFDKAAPKSLANYWVVQCLSQPASEYRASVEDRLHTVCRHIARQIADTFEREREVFPAAQMLVTGGGARNLFLVQCIQEALDGSETIKLIIPEEQIIDHKEAILMALLGTLRSRGQVNCFKSATGARRDTVGGQIHFGSSFNRVS